MDPLRFGLLVPLASRRRSSSCGMPPANPSFRQAPSGSCCHAPAGIWEQPVKSNFSSSDDWLNAWSKSAAPSAPFVSLLKHLSESICRIYLGTTTSAGNYPIHHLNSCNFQQTQINTRRKQENPSTISLCEALPEICLLQVEPLGTTNVLPRCCWDLMTVGKIQVFQLCPLAQGFKQICRSICSFRVFVEAPAVFCQKQPVESTLGLGQSKGTITYPGQLRLTRQLHHSDDAPKLEQLPTETNKYT